MCIRDRRDIGRLGELAHIEAQPHADAFVGGSFAVIERDDPQPAAVEDVVAGAGVPGAGRLRHAFGQVQIVVRLHVDHVREEAAGLQPDAWWIVAQVPHAGEHVPAAGGIGDELGADGFTFFGRKGDALRIRLDVLDAGVVFDRGAVVNGCLLYTSRCV